MPIDWKVFHKNWAAFPLQEMEPYMGEWVAWNLTGDTIIAHSSVSEAHLREQLRAEGLPAHEYAIEYIPGPGDVFDGAFIVSRGKEANNGAVSPTSNEKTTQSS